MERRRKRPARAHYSQSQAQIARLGQGNHAAAVLFDSYRTMLMRLSEGAVLDL